MGGRGSIIANRGSIFIAVLWFDEFYISCSLETGILRHHPRRTSNCFPSPPQKSAKIYQLVKIIKAPALMCGCSLDYQVVVMNSEHVSCLQDTAREETSLFQPLRYCSCATTSVENISQKEKQLLRRPSKYTS